MSNIINEVKNTLLTYPTVFRTVGDCLHHMFLVNVNGELIYQSNNVTFTPKQCAAYGRKRLKHNIVLFAKYGDSAMLEHERALSTLIARLDDILVARGTIAHKAARDAIADKIIEEILNAEGKNETI